ncbi:MmyB family transcriptional regulator [Streptomyces sp. NPDC055400]
MRTLGLGQVLVPERGLAGFAGCARELIGELSTLSTEFRTRWAAHDVRIHHGGVKSFNHPTPARWNSPTNRWTCPCPPARRTP